MRFASLDCQIPNSSLAAMLSRSTPHFALTPHATHLEHPTPHLVFLLLAAKDTPFLGIEKSDFMGSLALGTSKSYLRRRHAKV